MVLLPSPQAIFPSVSLPLSLKVFFSNIHPEYIPYCNFSLLVKGLSLLDPEKGLFAASLYQRFTYLKGLSLVCSFLH